MLDGGRRAGRGGRCLRAACQTGSVGRNNRTFAGLPRASPTARAKRPRGKCPYHSLRLTAAGSAGALIGPRAGKVTGDIEQGALTRMGRALLRVVVIASVVAVAGPAGIALAAPTVTIERPSSGAVANGSTPSFGGLAEESGGEVTLNIYSGTRAEGTPVQTRTTSLFTLGGSLGTRRRTPRTTASTRRRRRSATSPRKPAPARR